MSAKKCFSIVVPVYQNEANIDSTVEALTGLRSQLPNYSLQIVFVNDGSTDRSYELLHANLERHPDVITLVNLTRNFGQTPAIREGFRFARGDCVGVISADLQEPCELFVEMIRRWESGKKLVIAERTAREEGVVHRFVSGLYWKMVARWGVKGFPQGGYDFCLIDRQVVHELNGIGEKNTSIFPLIYWLGYDCDVLSCTRRKRSEGKSQWTLSKKIRLTVDTFINFTYLPVQFISFIGIAAFLSSLAYGLFLLVRFMVSGAAPQGWTSLALLIIGFGGLILLSLGIISEYLWRILDESRQRPGSIVDEVVNLSLDVNMDQAGRAA
ncbi:MAG: glycosyltransferase family 2 protein [Pirellulaceae bacterium]|nr:glycosyltransferase family 2 protein [Pirellulaceae bacterium]